MLPYKTSHENSSLNNNCKNEIRSRMENFEVIANECLQGLKEQFKESFYPNLGADEKKELDRRFDDFFNHTVYGGKMTRSKLSYGVFKALNGAKVVDIEPAMRVILSIELIQAVFLVIDDVMDGGETRRGKPCWYKMPSIGFSALNHALRLQNFVNISISEAIPQHKNLNRILRTVWETIQITSDGQELDGLSSKASDSTFERYSQIVANKTARYTFYHPIIIGFLLTNETNYSEEVWELSEKLGYYFQAQDDLLDFLNNDDVTGKTSCDIREGKCTWFSCKTMEKLKNNLDKRQRFERVYGQPDPGDIAEAKKIMDECQLLDDFDSFQNSMVEYINQSIDHFPIPEVRSSFKLIFASLINRKK